jgi:hypothetical protein
MLRALANWFLGRRSSRLVNVPGRTAVARRARPGVESLEDRVVPTLVLAPEHGAESIALGSTNTSAQRPTVSVILSGSYWNTAQGQQDEATLRAWAQNILSGPDLSGLKQSGSDGKATLAAGWRDNKERDLAAAREVQLALLPQSPPSVPDYAFHARYQAAQEVGGDYYDFVPLPGDRLAVLLGDVAGRGVPAALVMAKFSVEARVCLEGEQDLGAAISRLNEQMVRANLAGRFVTLAAVVLDPAGHTLTMVNAGHPYPLVYRAEGGAVEEAAPRSASGPPLGLFPGLSYAAQEVRLGPGEGLVLFSDGVTEAMSAGRQMFGADGVRAALGVGGLTAYEAGERLLRAVQGHAAGCEQSDDIALVCIGRTG